MNDLLEQRSTLLKIMSVLLVVFAGYMSFLDGRTMQSADLLALWLAGDFLANGQPDQVYPTVTTYFDMRAPDGWLANISAWAPDARLFPYIYPPLWAKLASFMTPLTSFAAFDSAMMVLNQFLLIAGIVLASHAGGLRKTLLWVTVAVTYAVLVLTLPIGIALGENQPQILVSFLIVAAFARAHSGHLRTAGALLALAASIKVYPLLFVVIFIGRKQWPALTSFAVTGAALGLASIALAGWALHAEYLHLLTVVSRSVIVTTFSFSIDAALAIGPFSDGLINVDQTNPDAGAGAAGWSSIAKTPLWAAVSGAAQLAALAAVAVLAAKRRTDILVLPLAAALFALLSPLSWAYTYLTTFFFLGVLATRSPRIGAAAVVLFFVAFHPSTASLTLDMALSGIWAFWIIGLAVISAITLCLLITLLRRPRAI